MVPARSGSPSVKLWIAVGKLIVDVDIPLAETGHRQFQRGKEDASRQGQRTPRQTDLAYRLGFHFFKQRTAKYREPFEMNGEGIATAEDAEKQIHAALRN
jgi:hypothetical protein